MEEKDKYVVYTGIEDGAATFALFEIDHDKYFDSDRLVGQIAIDPENVPEGTESEDHFWVELNEDKEITELQFDPELTKKKLAEAQDSVEKFKQLQEREKQRLNDDAE